MKNILIIVLSFATIAICAQEKNDSPSLRCCWKSVNGSKEGPCLSVHVKESTERSYIASFKINGYYDTEVLIGGVTFHKLSLGGYSTCGDIGQPELPAIAQLLINPVYTDCSVEISDEVWVEHPIGTIYPVLDDLLEGDTTYSLKQLPSELITNPQLLEIRKGSLYRGHNIFSVITCPFRYNPMHNSIEILSEFTLKVMFSGKADSKNVCNLNRGELSVFDNSNILQNVSQDSQTRSQVLDNDYLIITGDIQGIENCQALNDFRKWKAFKGHKTYVKSISEIGTTSDSIKSFITNEYNHNPNLKYVLFVGDVDKIPPVYIKSPSIRDMYVYSDYWYGCENNDYISNIGIGRFSSNNLIEISNMVNKTIKYESQYTPNGDAALLVAHKTRGLYPFQGNLNSVANATYNHPYKFEKAYGASSYYHGTESTNQDVTDSINSGVNIVCYRGHGLAKEWNKWNIYDESYDESEVANMDSSVCDVFFAISCLTGSIQEDTCMLESFTRAPNGAVAYFGATCQSRSSANKTLTLRIFSILLNDSAYHIGLLTNLSHLVTMQTVNHNYINTAKHNSLCYLWGGDPSLEVWTSKPHLFGNISLTEYIADSLSIQVDSVDVFNVSIVSKGGELLGLVELNNGATLPRLSNQCYYVINKHDYVPYIIYVDYSSHFIQNEDLSHDAYYLASPLSVGYNVTNTYPYGNVNIKSGAQVKMKKGNGVTIKNGFNVERGATLTIE